MAQLVATLELVARRPVTREVDPKMNLPDKAQELSAAQRPAAYSLEELVRRVQPQASESEQSDQDPVVGRTGRLDSRKPQAVRKCAYIHLRIAQNSIARPGNSPAKCIANPADLDSSDHSSLL